MASYGPDVLASLGHPCKFQRGHGGLTLERGMTETTGITWLKTFLLCTVVILQLRKVTGLTDAAKEHGCDKGSNEARYE